MKHFILILFFAASKLLTAQTITVTGTVKNEKGQPMPSVFVKEAKAADAAATYTNSEGFFSFAVAPYSKLNISYNGYNDTLVNVGESKNILVVLSESKTAKKTVSTLNSDNSVAEKKLLEGAVSNSNGVNNSFVYGSGGRNLSGTLFPVFNYKEETKGSRYLFDKWVHGYAKDINGQEIKNSKYLYNYDKIEGGLLMTQDKQSVIEIDRKEIQGFTIYASEQTPLIYENAPDIDQTHFVQLIASSSKYKIYKLTKTKFIKSDYHTNGISSTGNPYDEYADEDFYFLQNLADKKTQKFSLKKKSIKEAFASEGNKTNDYFSKHSQDDVNAAFLQDLIDYLSN